MSGKYINNIKSPWGILRERKKIINSQPSKIDTYDPIATLADKLHPAELNLIISEIRFETPSMRTFKLIPDMKAGTRQLPIFKSGQYISVKAIINNCPITRAYSLCSTPHDATDRGFYTISIKYKEDGFLTPYIFKNWSVGTKIKTSPPLGFFGYNEIRDSKELVGICEGCGITPMHSMIRNILQKKLPLTFTLFYGATTINDISFRNDLDYYIRKSEGKINIIHVLETPYDGWKGEVGRITSDIIKKYIDPKNKTFFLSGPPSMHNFLVSEISKLDIPRRRIRNEIIGENKTFLINDEILKTNMNRTFYITVISGKSSFKISAKGSESILIALEKSTVFCPSACRSGECGFCRSKLISGDIAINPNSDHRRKNDMILGYIHPCSTYPMSDLIIEIPVCE